MPKKKAPSERACSRLAKHERQAIERMPDRGKGRREIAAVRDGLRRGLPPGQKDGCERNHVEIRKLLPKGRGASLDRLTRAGAAPVMSRVNSEPRGGLARRSPAEMLLAALGDARALMDAFGVEMLEPAELDLTPGCVERAGAPIGARRRWRSNPAGTTESSPRHPSR